MIIPIYNKNKEQICETVIDDNIYEILEGRSVSFSNNYATIYIKEDKKQYRLHRYIYYNITGNIKEAKTVVDHINNDPLDNRLENLREISIKLNARNKKKQKNTSSSYYGAFTSNLFSINKYFFL